MQRRNLGASDQTVPIVGLGALEIGRDWGLPGPERGRPQEEAAFELLRAALDCGVDLWDTAPAYQLSEKRIGSFLAQSPADVFISTKTGELFDDEGNQLYDFSKEGTKRFIARSLENLQVERIDMLFIHCGADEVDVIESDEAFAVMDDARGEGEIRFLGTSPNTVAGAEATIGCGLYDAIQINFNAFEQEMAPQIERAAGQGMAVFVRGSLAMGFATERAARFRAKFPELQTELAGVERQLAEAGLDLREALLRFAAWYPGVTLVLSGTKHPEHLRGNVAAVNRGPLPEEIERAIRGLSRWQPVVAHYYAAIFGG